MVQHLKRYSALISKSKKTEVLIVLDIKFKELIVNFGCLKELFTSQSNSSVLLHFFLKILHNVYYHIKEKFMISCQSLISTYFSILSYVE